MYARFVKQEAAFLDVPIGLVGNKQKCTLNCYTIFDEIKNLKK